MLAPAPPDENGGVDADQGVDASDTQLAVAEDDVRIGAAAHPVVGDTARKGVVAASAIKDGEGPGEAGDIQTVVAFPADEGGDIHAGEAVRSVAGQLGGAQGEVGVAAFDDGVAAGPAREGVVARPPGEAIGIEAPVPGAGLQGADQVVVACPAAEVNGPAGEGAGIEGVVTRSAGEAVPFDADQGICP